MYTAGTTNWLNNRSGRGRIAQSVATLPLRERTRDLFSTVDWGRLVPFWAVLATVMLATTAVCATVIIRAQSQFSSAAAQQRRTVVEIDALRRSNEQLKLEIARITSDSNAIELAARERLGMVRPNDIVVPIESIKTSSAFGTVSFVR